MTDRHHDHDSLDRAAEEIRAQKIDDATARRITDAVRERLGIGGEDHLPLRSCEDFQAEIPAFVAGTLSEGRALLVGDHTRECVPCRRVLMEARGVTTPVSPQHSVRKAPGWLGPALRIAAAVLLIFGGVVTVRTVGNVLVDRNLRASVETVDGSLQLVEDNSSLELAADAGIRSREVLRTARNSGAILRLADGSMIEMDERSELRLRASRRGTTVDLARGNIIVHAADQGSGRLFVATNDCEVAVKGTIFAVNHGLKGSRVSVIEGEVEVSEGATHALLRPGDQITTGHRLRRVPLEEEISWSRDAAKHKALLRELTDLRRVLAETIDNAPPRTSTFLLDLAPGDTLVYAAMPNISEDLDEARAAFYERLASSEVLADWWQQNVVANGADEEIDLLLDRLQPIGEAIGAEAIVAVPVSAIREQGMPLFMAELDDPASFMDQLTTVIEQANAEAGEGIVARLVDDPQTATSGSAEVFMWVEGNLFAASGNLEALQLLEQRVSDPGARAFMGSKLHTQLTETYSGGVSWLFAADLAAAIAEGTTGISEEEIATMEGLGLLDTTTLVIERHRDGEWYATTAEVRFSQQRHGIMAWLAEPAPMGSLEFVSPDAYVAASAVSKDGAEMFDDLLEFATTQDMLALEQLRLFEGIIGIDLREDFAATIGGEATFALDGPVLPIPSLKLIVEVYDPGTLIHTIERAVDLVNVQFAAQGEPLLAFEESDGSGRTYYTIRREGFDRLTVFTTIDGYLVAAASRALVEQAIDYRAAGVTLAGSAAFQALLPDNGFSDCSALVYRDLGALLDAVPPEMLGQLEFADAMSDSLSQGLVCLFAEDDRITASATGGSLVGLASVFGMTSRALAEKSLTEEVEETEAVSSL
jgi:ferric-dicitrate binding protein FerR (iron transport regulator)